MNSRDQRALRLGAVVIALAFVGLRLLPAGLRWVTSEREKLAQERRLLVETEALVLGEPGLEDSVAALTARIGQLAPTLLKGQTNTEAEADLASRVSLSAERQQMTVGPVVGIPDSLEAAGGGIHRVTVRATLTGDARELLRLLDTLARSNPTITPAALRVVAPEPGAASSSAEALNAELTVTGWYLVKVEAS